MQGEVELGYARPSLLIELGLEPHDGVIAPDSLAAIDAQRGFVAHRKLLARFAERKRAIARVYGAALTQAGLAVTVAEVVDDRKRGLVARLARTEGVDEAAVTTCLGQFAGPWGWA